MVQNEVDTIVAEATPRGRGGVGVVRISGPKTSCIAEQILGKIPEVRRGEYLSFFTENGELLDQGIALYFKSPHSFTGEDVLELQGHGGPVVMTGIVQAVVNAGARIAEPGEFSLRAFLNNKIDLLQAEAISDLINANSKEAARGALRSLQGDFSKILFEMVEKLIHLRMYVEAAIDFPEEEIDFLNDGKVKGMLINLMGEVKKATEKAQQGNLMADGIKVVIVGKPNAGKSSLLNTLSGYEVAIVTDIPGTTRDVLREQICIDGLLVQLVDTAGLRIHEAVDVVEQEGIRRALKEVSLADHVVMVVDGSETEETNPKLLFSEWMEMFPKEVGVTVLVNKIDLTNKVAKVIPMENYTVVNLSVKTGDGINLFSEHLKRVSGFSTHSEGNFIARKRHLIALKEAEKHLQEGFHQLEAYRAGELLAEELRQAQLMLNQITGQFTTDDLLGKIFSEFCIGK